MEDNEKLIDLNGLKTFKNCLDESGVPTVDTAARELINSHIDNLDVHVTEDEKATWNNKAELTDIPNIADLMQNLNTWTSGDIKGLTLAANSGCVFIYSDVTGLPKENAYWFGIVNASTAHRNLLVFQIDGLYSGYCSYNCANGLWSDWKPFADGGNAASVGAYTEAKIAALEARIAALENGGTT